MHSFKICEEKFECLGEGSSRRVYGLDTEWALKKAISNGGIWQNKNEIQVYKKYKNSTMPLCPIDLSRSTNEHIVMRRVVPINELPESDDELYSSFDGVVMDYVDECHIDYITPAQKREFIKDLISEKYDPRLIEFIKRLARFKSETIHHLFYDTCSFNCGLMDNKVVILDYGYPDVDEHLRPDFYKPLEDYEEIS